MMQAQPTGMIQINYKNDHFDEINKKFNVEKYECPSIALTAIALIWNEKQISFSQLVFICTSISRSAWTRKTPFRFKEILVKHTHRKANEKKLRSLSKKELMTLFGVHFGLPNCGKLPEILQQKEKWHAVYWKSTNAF